MLWCGMGQGIPGKGLAGKKAIWRLERVEGIFRGVHMVRYGRGLTSGAGMA